MGRELQTTSGYRRLAALRHVATFWAGGFFGSKQPGKSGLDTPRESADLTACRVIHVEFAEERRDKAPRARPNLRKSSAGAALLVWLAALALTPAAAQDVT